MTKNNDDDILEGFPYLYICQLKDMVDKINIQLDTCNDDDYKSQFRMIRKEVNNVIDYFDEIFNGDIVTENLK